MEHQQNYFNFPRLSGVIVATSLLRGSRDFQEECITFKRHFLTPQLVQLQSKCWCICSRVLQILLFSRRELSTFLRQGSMEWDDLGSKFPFHNKDDLGSLTFQEAKNYLFVYIAVERLSGAAYLKCKIFIALGGFTPLDPSVLEDVTSYAFSIHESLASSGLRHVLRESLVMCMIKIFRGEGWWMGWGWQ